MVAYWTNFVHTGNPNGSGLPEWKPFQAGKSAQRLAPGPGGITAIDPATTHHCDLWATVHQQPRRLPQPGLDAEITPVVGSTG